MIPLERVKISEKYKNHSKGVKIELKMSENHSKKESYFP